MLLDDMQSFADVNPQASCGNMSSEVQLRGCTCLNGLIRERQTECRCENTLQSHAQLHGCGREMALDNGILAQVQTVHYN